MYGIEGKKEYPDFEKYRAEGYVPSKEEIEYCLQDSRIMAVAIESELRAGHRAMTLSSDAFDGVKKTIGGYSGWREHMPILAYEDETFARLSYRGGWVYVNPKFRNKELENVHVYDVNSLYPWVMHDCPLPVGYPCYAKPKGNELYIINFQSEYVLESGFPFVQTKFHTGLKNMYLAKSNGIQSLTMTSVDFKLFDEHYLYTIEEEPIYMSFKSRTGLLAPYVDQWMQVKEDAVKRGDMATKYIAKRWLNSPYGKTGMNPLRLNRIPLYSDDALTWDVQQVKVDPVYVPYATFVCAWARDKTIRSCIENEDAFVYADTDSMHLLREADNIDVHPTKLGAWKHESFSERAKYIRPKTYIHASQGRIEVTCAGMPDAVKEQVTWDNFKVGSVFQGKKMKKNVRGGCMIVDRTFEIKEE